jgi:hypothetical protein
MKPSTIAVGALILSALVSCSPAPAGHTPASSQAVAMDVQPRTTDLQAGGTAQFAAVVTGTADTSVVWDVIEASGGAVDATGLYTAPSTAGVFHVRATSRASPTAQAESTVNVVAPPVVSVAISPRTPSVVAGGTIAFTAAVSNASNTAVTWSVPTPGCGTITQAGVYTAPAVASTCAVVATSQQDPSRSDTVNVTVTAPPPPIVVTITPSPGAADSCRTATFSATVTGTSNTAVTWSVQEGATGGTITSTGVYTAPSSAGTYHVVATSAADASRSAIAPVAVTDRVLSVVVSPQTIQIPPGGTAQFTAAVTTTCGTSTATKTVNSFGQVVAN